MNADNPKIYLMQARKQDHPDGPFTGWSEIAFERFDYVECSISQKNRADLTSHDLVLIERYGCRPEGWIEPHNSPFTRTMNPAPNSTPEPEWPDGEPHAEHYLKATGQTIPPEPAIAAACTPETDAVWRASESKDWKDSFAAMHDHADNLERRFAPLRAELAETKEKLQNAVSGMGLATHAELKETFKTVETISQLRAELERLREENRDLRIDRERARDGGNRLYAAIVERMQPHFDEASRDLDWDVLPGTVSRVCFDLQTAKTRVAELERVLRRERAENMTLQKGAPIGAFESFAVAQVRRIDAALAAHQVSKEKPSTN